MAEDNKPKTSDDIENELTAGKFAAQQARTIGLTLGGAALGVAAAFAAAKLGLANSIARNKKIIEIAEQHGGDAEKLPSAITKGLNIAGGVIGFFAGSIASTYERWVKVERERLSVKEINKDVASLMEKRVQFEETLDTQHKVVQDMLKKHESGLSKSEQVLSDREKSASVEAQR